MHVRVLSAAASRPSEETLPGKHQPGLTPAHPSPPPHPEGGLEQAGASRLVVKEAPPPGAAPDPRGEVQYFSTTRAPRSRTARRSPFPILSIHRIIDL